MRYRGQMVGGFFAAPQDAISLALSRLEVQGASAILDPCCGQAAALAQLAEGLGLMPRQVYGVELEPSRAQASQERLPQSMIVGPADFLSMAISANSFGFIWCNPPFDDEGGGIGRVEYSFVARSTQLLVAGGIMALACPERLLTNYDLRRHFHTHYLDVSADRFPTNEYNEVIIWGKKRSRPVQEETSVYPVIHLGKGYSGKYLLPPAGGPKRFEKIILTPREAVAAIRQSPLSKVFRETPVSTVASPPLELSKGQMALVLAGGFLNTTIARPGEDPILIKATPIKEQYLKEQSTEIQGAGTKNEKEVSVSIYSERIKLKIRVAEQDGSLHDVD